MLRSAGSRLEVLLRSPKIVAQTLWFFSWMSVGRLGLNYNLSHVRTHKMSTLSSTRSQTRSRYLKMDNQREAPNILIFTPLHHFLWWWISSGWFLLMQQPLQLHTESPLSFCTKLHIFPQTKLGQGPAYLLLGAEGCADEQVAHLSLWPSPFITAILQLGINLLQKPGVTMSEWRDCVFGSPGRHKLSQMRAADKQMCTSPWQMRAGFTWVFKRTAYRGIQPHLYKIHCKICKTLRLFSTSVFYTLVLFHVLFIL